MVIIFVLLIPNREMREYLEIHYGEGAESGIVIGSLGQDFASLVPLDKPRIIIITDARVHSSNMAFINTYDHIVIGQGESTKTFVKIEEIYRQLLDMNADRKTFLIGMGGGIVTDITGFVASTYMRGVRFGFIPTTLLSQVDASIGGKNGVNLDGYKNIIGTFNQPEFVLCDPELLSTLSDKELRGGLAEVIKAGIIGDPELFSMIESNPFEKIKSDKNLLREIILRAIKVKTEIVERDEREHGERRKLNLGHTFGHAIEKSTLNFSHGEAVAVGMSIICDAAVKLGKLMPETSERIKNVITSTGLSTECPIEIRRLLSAIKQDKKREGKIINLVFPLSIGSCEIEKIDVEHLDNIFLNTAASVQ